MLRIYTTIAAQFAALRKDEKGISALEYGVLGAVIIVGLGAAFAGLIPALTATVGEIVAAL